MSDETDSSTRFDLDALELGLLADWNKTFRLEAQLDATRSSSPESLFGIDGNSVIFTARRALGALTLPLGPGDLTLAFGILPDPVLSTIENLDSRDIDDALGDTGRFLPRSDLGASLRYDLGRLALTLAVTNGEGARAAERDNGKDLIAMLEATPLTFEVFGESARLFVMVTGRSGSRGVGSLPQNHLGVRWRSPSHGSPSRWKPTSLMATTAATSTPWASRLWHPSPSTEAWRSPRVTTGSTWTSTSTRAADASSTSGF